jgi:hypothetical protein
MSWIDTLRRIMPPHPGAGNFVEWHAIEASWGTRFPSDYKEFVALYGEGGVEDYLDFVLPVPGDVFEADSSQQGMLAETRNALNLWEAETGTDRRPQLIAWGVDASADILCWRVAGGDPDDWPVIVWNQDEAQWFEYKCGMSEFLCRVFRGDFDECPLGGIPLWGNESPRFLHEREERRIRQSGIDPWTGNPDPYAGMFGE